LVAQRFAAAGGHEYQCVAPVDDGLDNRFLRATKAGVTEGLLKDVEGGGHRAQYTVLPAGRGAAPSARICKRPLKNQLNC